MSERPLDAATGALTAHDGSAVMLGGIGSGRPLANENWAEQGVIGFNSRDPRSRSFNLLRSQVLKLADAEDWRVIGVTSPTPQVGKSFIAANLAASLSRLSTVRTLLFDLDIRRASVAEAFGIQAEAGLEEYLAGNIERLDDIRYDVTGTNLSIFPCQLTDWPSSELLASERLQNMIAAVRAQGRRTIAICDLPPTFANDDAAIVMRQIDAYMLIVEQGRSTARQVEDAIKLMRPAPCLGTVLNRYRGGIGSDDYGFGYGRQAGYENYYS